jgi:hypothetical protein
MPLTVQYLPGRYPAQRQALRGRKRADGVEQSRATAVNAAHSDAA